MHLAIANQPRAMSEASRVHELPNTNPSTYALSVAYHAGYGFDASVAYTYTAPFQLKSSRIHNPWACVACAAASARENRLSRR